MVSRDDLRANYTARLRAHVEEPSEQTLSNAYALGRACVNRGFGIVDLVSAHGHAVQEFREQGLTGTEASAREAAFLLECLAPLDMAYRGFLEANATMRKLNDELDSRVRERTAELSETNAELEAFTYSVSHDLRTPLRAMSMFSGILQEDCSATLDEQGRHAVQRISENAARMATLIDELLKLSRLSRREITPVKVDLADITRQVVEELDEQDPTRVVHVHVTHLPTARGDPDLLRIALTNLLSNAYKFTRGVEGAQVTVGCVVEDGTAVYQVQDNGVGFDPSQATRLFQPFQRLETASEFPGLGIGLATAQRIIRRHGGRIWAVSEPGAGARFSFTLPR